MIGERMIKEGLWSAFFGSWYAIFIFIPLEAYIFYKAFTDSVILNYDIYVEKIKRFMIKYLPSFLLPEKYRKKRRKAYRRRNNKKK